MDSRPVDIIFPEAREQREQGKCPTCDKDVGEFRDPLSRKEFEISGMCQKCQDSVFGGSDDG